MYKMFEISSKAFAKNKLYNIIDGEKKLWLRNKDVGEKLSVENIYDLIGKEIKGAFKTNIPIKQKIREYKKRRSGLIDDDEKFMYTHEDMMMPITMSYRVSTPEAIKIRSKLGFQLHDLILNKERSVILKITKLFSNEKILLQHRVLGYRIDLYFPKQKLAITFDE